LNSFFFLKQFYNSFCFKFKYLFTIKKEKLTRVKNGCNTFFTFKTFCY
ncbi:hypothetical protein M153_15800002652, partial [Pseudoloma neurophilia]